MRYLAFLALTITLLSGCSATDTAVTPSSLGIASNMRNLQEVANEAGTIQFEKHLAAKWHVPLSGLLNLEHPTAIASGLTDREEAIQLYVYLLKHPEFGNYLIDSGISVEFLDAENNSDISPIVDWVMDISALEAIATTKNLFGDGIDGVFLTHIHMDHIMGLNDVSPSVSVYTGPGEKSSKSLEHAATRGTSNRLLRNVRELHEWQFSNDGVIDVFGDGSLWAIHSPGHSPGSTAFLVRTTSGPQLLLGDVSHTRWGWDNAVEPGSYSKDISQSAISLKRLITLSEENPKIVVHPGHQE